MAINILFIVTNVDKYANSTLATGLWLSELTHIYDQGVQNGWTMTIASPKGGNVPLDPESLKPLILDKVSKKYLDDRVFMDALGNSRAITDVKDTTFDAVYLAGGHATMYDFPDDENLQEIVRNHYESGRKVGAICHGVGGLLNVRLSNGEYLIAGREITGFDWFEETLARRKKYVPFNLEEAIKDRGAHLKKALIPMTSNVVVDGNLITGQNPFSSTTMAEVMASELKK